MKYYADKCDMVRLKNKKQKMICTDSEWDWESNHWLLNPGINAKTTGNGKHTKYIKAKRHSLYLKDVLFDPEQFILILTKLHE